MSDFGSLIFYIIMFTISTLFIYFSEKNKDTKVKKICVCIGLLIPILISALRWNVGSDFMVYVNKFNWYNGNIGDSFEFLYFIIINISKLLGNVQFMFSIYSILTVVFVYKALKYNKEKYPIALTFFIYIFLYFIQSFNIMRQLLAVAIIFYAYRYLYERNIKKFIFFNILACLSHTTAIFFFPVYFMFFKNKEKNRKIRFKQILYFILIIVVVLNFDKVINQLTNMNAFERYSLYSEKVASKNRTAILKVMLLIYFFIFRKKYVKYDDRNNTYILLFIIGTILEFLGYNSPYIKRIAMYFSISEIYLLGCMPKLFKNNNTRIFIVFGIILYVLAFFILSYYILRQANVIPYNSILFNT